MPKFSIIIPTYNRANFLVSSIASALDQEYADFEVIVVDDASTDNTEEVVKSIKSDKLIYIKKDINEERAAARNTGVKTARGEFVYFHDSDDLLYPDHLKEAEKLISQHPTEVFFCLGYEIVERGKSIKSISNFSGDLNEKIIRGNFLSCKAFVRRTVSLQFPFNEDRELSGSEDYELWLRLAGRFTLYCSNVITSALILHEGRSVQNEQPEKLIRRIELLEHYLMQDEVFLKKYQKKLKYFLSDNQSYIALHLSMSSYKIEAIKYLAYCFLKAPLRAVSTRRFYSTAAKILSPFKWI